MISDSHLARFSLHTILVLINFVVFGIGLYLGVMQIIVLALFMILSNGLVANYHLSKIPNWNFPWYRE